LIEFGILPHQLIDCTLREFIFDMSILSDKKDISGIKSRMEETIKRWELKHKK